MADAVDLKGVVKHLVDGTFDQSLCRICLLPFGEVCENIFTKICKEDQDFCIADVLYTVCQVKFTETENCNVCSDCFVMATTTYKFYIMSRRSEEILNFYVNELEKNVYSIEEPNDSSNDTLCITLPEYTPTVNNFNYNIEGCLVDQCIIEHEETDAERLYKIKTESGAKARKQKWDINDEEIVIVIDKNGRQSYYKLSDDSLVLSPVAKKSKKTLNTDAGNKKVSNRNKKVSNNDVEKADSVFIQKIRRKRDPMVYTSCSRCPVKYRFLAKLQSHMKNEHNVELFICKICKACTEDKKEHEDHLSSHTGIHRCYLCNTIFKKRETIINHLKWHKEMKNNIDMDAVHVCEVCGFILPSEMQLKDHYDKKHDKKFTCFYCGKMYKGELGWGSHIRKHEIYMKKKEKKESSENELPSQKKMATKDRIMCTTCGKNFVDERSLMWHSRLHTNERPYTCDTCGRGFISLNRRNQHAVCAHTKPSRRCPLCPALFHLRSMVNSHIKKVHLKAHKRRNRSSKHQNMNVHWRTEPVPIQELGIDIQNEILDLQTRQDRSLGLQTGQNTSKLIDDEEPSIEWM